MAETVEEKPDTDKVEIYSQKVRAGKRTYFFDIKSTRSNDFYLTVTESKKRIKDDVVIYEKHKIFLYKEDIMKFTEALQQTIDHLKNELIPEYDFSKATEKEVILEDDTELKWD
jgi:hypothetical protein